MKAMIFAAGLGTRLAPLTDQKPKALVCLNGKPMLQIVLEKVIAAGISSVVVNVHHFADQIIDFLKTNNNFGIDIRISDERTKLLDTGGGLKFARKFLDDGEAFLLHNADIVSDINFKELFAYHEAHRSLATLAVMNARSDRRLKFDATNSLCAWENVKTGEIKIARQPDGAVRAFSFAGIHIIEPAIFNHIKEKDAFSIIDMYLRLAENHRITCFPTNPSYWYDLGKIDDLQKAESFFMQP